MALTTRIPAHIRDSEIRAQIAELEATTDEDNPLDPWESVEELEAELKRREDQAIWEGSI